MNQDNINRFLNKYIEFTDNISEKYNYPSNIRHVLWLIIPAFIIKYGISEERKILSCFSDVPIYISGVENKRFTAYFNRKLHSREENGNIQYYSSKEIVINNYTNSSLLELIDNLVHEFNHAINSIINEVKWNDNEVCLRTGLSYICFYKDNIDKVKCKSKDIILEEIINTKQTASIIDIINSFNNYSIDNGDFINTLYALKHDIEQGGYKSGAYYLQSYICKELVKNKTFIPTVENLRFKGNVEDIENWFDNITGIVGSYKKLIKLLNEIVEMENEIPKVKFFKKIKINNIIAKGRKVMEIINIFDKNCIYK